ncbi:MAG: ATP-dependent nuclease subunit B [Trueperaceae bacterium]
MQLFVAPPARGKTTHLLQVAREAIQQDQRVWWVGLPSQRSYVYRRATEAGAVLGLEFLSGQQVYYRLLANALKLKPLIVGTGRLALVGEALLNLRQELPAPGEARLFANAIAEAKRYGLGYKNIRPSDEESERFRDVFRIYETIKAERWDYDDFRTEALNLAENLEKKVEANVIIVDGFREIGPLELRIYKALSKHCNVYVSLPDTPPGETATLELSLQQNVESTLAPSQTFKAANPVTEARWVLRSLKKDLACGLDPLDIAVILPEREIKAFTALADEYGVPMMDETPKALADTLTGRLLLDLLELPDYPTASKLLAIPELSQLANAALNAGVAGPEAINVLAQQLGNDAPWKKWLGVLEVPENELAWAESLLETTLPDIRKSVTAELRWQDFKKHALQRAKEASSLAKGASFRAWWAALLQETFLFDAPKGGVALLTQNLASGRRFKKAYLMRANEGAYTVGEGEDYFIPEEERASLETTFAKLGLPKRFLGRDKTLYAELLTRADEMIVTYPEADQGGPLVAEAGLVDIKKAQRLPILPAASRLELPTEATYKAAVTSLKLTHISIEKLRRYEQCAFRYWAEEHLPENTELPWWRDMLRDMREYKKLNTARLETLKTTYPQAALWLVDNTEKLLGLEFGVSVPEDSQSLSAYPGFSAYIDAASRSENDISFYRFVEPGSFKEQREAANYIDNRWNELWAAGYMLGRYQGRIKKISVYVWSMLGQPLSVYDGGVTYVWRRIQTKQQKATTAFERFQAGNVSPSHGFHCRECRVFDVCREGKR